MRFLLLFISLSFIISLFPLTFQADSQPTWIERVDLRTQNGKTFQNIINPTRYSLDVSIASVHYDGPDWKDIDNTIIPSAQSVPELGLARWEMVQDDYEWFALQDFNTVPMFLYRNRSIPDSYVTFTPHLVQWTNDLNQIASVSVANTGITGIVQGNTISFPNGYGTGIDFEISLGPGRMGKILRLNNPLPTPPQYILDGGNASLEFVQFFSIPSGLNRPDIVVDRILWDEKTRRETFNAIEFQIAGKTIFAFVAGNAFNGLGNIPVQYILSKAGNNLKIAIRTSYEWLQGASYPVRIDPSIDVQVDATPNDGWEAANGNTDTTSGQPNIDNVDEWLAWRWTSITIPNAATIDSADMDIYFPNSGGDEPDVDMWGHDVDDSWILTAGPANNNISARTPTTATIAYEETNLGAPGWFNPPSVSAIVAEITVRGGWSSGNSLMIFGRGTSSTRDMLVSTYDDVPSRASWLNITYTAEEEWSNTAPVIFQTLVSNETGHNLTYTEYFNATDIDTNQTLWWSISTNLSSAGVEFDNRSAWVNSTPTFAERDSSYYINITAADQGCSGACNLTDYWNWTLYVNNTLPVITDGILTDEGGHNISYSEDFDFTDTNSDSGSWAINSNASFLSVNGAGTVSGTPLFADRDSTFYVNVTVRDYVGGQGGTDYTNYTLYINNTLPSITDKISTDEGGHNISYSEDFTPSDANSDSGIWSLVTNATFLSIDSAGTVSGTPLFADRDSDYYVNATFRDYTGGQSGFDYTNYTLWINNTVISISNPISDDTGVNNTAYSYNFNHADANSDTPDWNVTTNAPFSLSVSASGVVSGTPDTIGTFWVNVTVQDYIGGQGGFDWVNYTLEITEEAVEVPVDFTTIVIFIAGVIPFSLAIAIGFWQKQATFLFIGGLIGTLLGLWVIYSIFWIAGFSFVAISILFMYVGWVNVETGNLG